MGSFPEFQRAFCEIQKKTGFRPLTLATSLGVAPCQISRWLNGQTRPSKAHLRRLLDDFRYVRDGQIAMLDAEEKAKLILSAGYYLPEFASMDNETLAEVSNCLVYSDGVNTEQVSNWIYLRNRTEVDSEDNLDVMMSYLQLARPVSVSERVTMLHGYRKDAARKYALDLESDFRRTRRALQQGRSIRYVSSYAPFVQCFQEGNYEGLQLTRQEVNMWALRLLRLMEASAALQIRLNRHQVPRHLALCGERVMMYEFEWPPHALNRHDFAPIGIKVESPNIVKRFRRRFDAIWSSADTQVVSREFLVSLVNRHTTVAIGEP